MTKPQRIKFFGTWNRCVKHMTSTGGYTKSECESERQAMLKLAGAIADDNGRYSANTLTNDGVSTCLDYMRTSILGLKNRKSRSRTIIYTIDQLGLDDALLDKVAGDIFKATSWRDLNEVQLAKFRYTAKRLARTAAEKS